MDFGYIFVFCGVGNGKQGENYGKDSGLVSCAVVDAFVFFLVETLCVRRDIINQNVHYVRLLKV